MLLPAFSGNLISTRGSLAAERGRVSPFSNTHTHTPRTSWERERDGKVPHQSGVKYITQTASSSNVFSYFSQFPFQFPQVAANRQARECHTTFFLHYSLCHVFQKDRHFLLAQFSFFFYLSCWSPTNFSPNWKNDKTSGTGAVNKATIWYK